MVCVYVPLLEEGTSVVRPTTGVWVKANIFRLLPTENYDPSSENWEFLPGSLVVCVQEIWEGKEIWVARYMVSELAVGREKGERWWRKGEGAGCGVSLRPGQPCPRCQEAELMYDELFRLLCPLCGYGPESGAFT